MDDNDEIITEIIKREVGSGPNPVNDPLDSGGLTYDGISSRANPDLFLHGLPTHEQTRQRFEDRYLIGPGFDKITDYKLKSLLVDWGVNSGPGIAIKGLQEVVGATPDGVLGPMTLAALAAMHPEDAVNGVVAKRIQMIGRIVTRNPSQVRFLNGWLNRAVEWLG